MLVQPGWTRQDKTLGAFWLAFVIVVAASTTVSSLPVAADSNEYCKRKDASPNWQNGEAGKTVRSFVLDANFGPKRLAIFAM